MNRPRSRPILYAHRGAAAELPENTLPAFGRALELGADALETDLHMTIDGHIVAAHDPDGYRMTGISARIRDVTLAEVPTWDAGHGFVDSDGSRPFVNQGYRIPTLEQLLCELPPVPLNLDIKQWSPSMLNTLLALLSRTGSERRVTLASFRTQTMFQVRRHGYVGRTALAMGDVLSLLALPRTLQVRIWGSERASFALQIPTHRGPIRLDTPARIREWQALGLQVEYWTINDPAEARMLLERGADGIMTDDPALIKPVLDDFLAQYPAARSGGDGRPETN